MTDNRSVLFADNRSVLMPNESMAYSMMQSMMPSMMPVHPQENVVIIPEFKFGRTFEGKKVTGDQDIITPDRIVCLYFAASYCHPCKAFTPKLIEFYNEVNSEDEKLLEIILVPFDKNEEDCKKYFRTMPWISLPYDTERIESYRNHFSVKGIPQLVVLNREGNILIQDAGKEVLKKGEDAFLDWVKLIQEQEILAQQQLSMLQQSYVPQAQIPQSQIPQSQFAQSQMPQSQMPQSQMPQ